MINNNNKTTILITSIMISAILLLPSAAFGEDPLGCATGTGNVMGSLTIDPFNKDTLGGDVFVTYEIEIPNIGDPDSCDGDIAFFGLPNINIDGTIASNDGPDGDCPAATADLIRIVAGQTIQLWGPTSVYGMCNVGNDLLLGTNNIFGIANVGQYNNDGPAPSEQAAVNSASKSIYDVCLNVDKTGVPGTPAKVKLIDGEAEVGYIVTITNCANSPGLLDTCVLVDPVIGEIPFGPLASGDSFQVAYTAIIDGDTTNVATVTCEDQQDNPISESDDHVVMTYTAEILVEKEAQSLGGPVEYMVWITNVGSSTLENCIIFDPTVGFLDDTSCLSIAPDEQCHVDYTGVACIDSVPNTAFVECQDQLGLIVSGESEEVPVPECAPPSVDIFKVCDTKVVQVPGNPDPIDCSITVTNDGTSTLTNCVVTDTLTGDLTDFADTFVSGASQTVNTSTEVTPEQIAEMTVTNTATVDCITEDGSDLVSAAFSVDIEVRSVDASVQKMCETVTQTVPPNGGPSGDDDDDSSSGDDDDSSSGDDDDDSSSGDDDDSSSGDNSGSGTTTGTIDWNWKVTNTSSDGKSSLDVSCDGVSTINDPEAQDDLLTVLAFGGMATNMWTESGLAAGDYSDTITCTFTAQDDKTFDITAEATCIVEPVSDCPTNGVSISGDDDDDSSSGDDDDSSSGDDDDSSSGDDNDCPTNGGISGDDDDDSSSSDDD